MAHQPSLNALLSGAYEPFYSSTEFKILKEKPFNISKSHKSVVRTLTVKMLSSQLKGSVLSILSGVFCISHPVLRLFIANVYPRSKHLSGVGGEVRSDII